jgi:hypothetical protein
MVLGENGPRDPNPAAVRTKYGGYSKLRFRNVASGSLPLVLPSIVYGAASNEAGTPQKSTDKPVRACLY